MSNCSPDRSIKDNGSSCFLKQDLIQIARTYNMNHNDKIKLNQSKSGLYNDLRKKFSCTMKNDICILESMGIERDTILKPRQPDGAYAWLSTIDINDVMKQYERKYSSFLFLGTVPIDFKHVYPNIYNVNITKSKKTKFGIVFNLDKSHMPGSHWVSLFIDKKAKSICFFDSIGDDLTPEILEFIQRININDNYQIIINDKVHQTGNNACGVYALYFIIERLKGKTCNSIFSKIIKDRDMNKNRKKYFSTI